MKKMIKFYIILSFLIGIGLVLFTGGIIRKDNEEIGRYEMYIENDGQTIYILDTKTGAFQTYISRKLYNESSHSYFTYLLIDEVDSAIGAERIKEIQDAYENKYHEWLQKNHLEDTPENRNKYDNRW